MNDFAAATAEERVAAQMAFADLPLKTFLTDPVIPNERLNPDYRPGALGAAAWFVCGIAYFALYARRRLILSPEEVATAQEKRA